MFLHKKRNPIIVTFVLLVVFLNLIATPLHVQKVYAEQTPGGSPSTTAASAPIYSLSIKDRAISYYYYYAMKSCLSNHSEDLSDIDFLYGTYINYENATKGIWFTQRSSTMSLGSFQSSAMTAPTFLSMDVFLESEKEGPYYDGVTKCNNIIPAAAKLWKTTPIDMLCTMIEGAPQEGNSLRREDGFSCRDANTRKHFRGGFSDGQIAALLSIINKALYTDPNGNIVPMDAAMGPAAGKYMMYYSALTETGCGLSEASPQSSGANVIDDFPVIDMSTGEITKKKMITSRTFSDKVKIYSDGHKDIETTCQYVVDEARKEADGASDFIKKAIKSGQYTKPGETDCDQNPGAPECQKDPSSEGQKTCAIDGIGWLVCPVVTFLAQVSDTVKDNIDEYLVFNPSELTKRGDGSIYSYWATMRNYANVLFVIAFIIIIYSQISGMGLNTYGIKRILPRLVVGALLVNVSFYLCVAMVDLSNVIGASAYNFISSGAGPAPVELTQAALRLVMLGGLLQPLRY